MYYVQYVWNESSILYIYIYIYIYNIHMLYQDVQTGLN